MQSMQMQVTTRFDPEQRFRLLQLTPKLEETLRHGELTLRSNGDSVYLCTDRTTHFVRRLKQSNTLILAHAQDDGLEGFAAPTELLETIETPGDVDWTQFAVYKGTYEPLPPAQPVQLVCSPDEYAQLSRAKPVVELNGGLYVVAPGVVHDVLVDIVSGMVEREDLELKTALEDVQLETKEPPAVVRAVYNMFASDDSSTALDVTKITQWTGIYILTQHPQGMPLREFHQEWTQDLPIRMRTRLEDLAEAVETRPGFVRYVDKSLLDSEPRTRFSELFRLKKSWLLTEIEPFVAELVPPTQKLENWILKYARKTRQGKDFVISARKL